jgi:hypothetical protein
MRSSILWVLLPDEALPLLLVGAAVAVMLGLLRPRALVGLLGLCLLLPVIGAGLEVLLGQLPAWVSLLVLVGLGLALLRGLAALLIGTRAADTMVGTLAADVVRLVVMAVFGLPIRLARWAIRLVTQAP